MMRVFGWWMVLTGCASDGKGGGDSAADTGAAANLEAETAAAMEGYQSWSQAASWEGIQPSESVHGNYTQVWWNDVAYTTYEAQAGAPLPVGSLLVKESYTDETGTDIVNLTVMYKASDEYGWFWSAWSPEGDVQMSGQLDYCSDCHVAGQDYVLSATW